MVLCLCMKKTAVNTSKNSKTKYVLLAILGIVILLIGWWAWGQFAPKPLGDRLVYIGREDYGNFPFFSDSKPGVNYRYTTGMSIHETEKYFKNASLFKPTEQDSGNLRVWLHSTKQNKEFIIYYYDSGAASGTLGIQTKQNIVVVPGTYYNLAKESL